MPNNYSINFNNVWINLFPNNKRKNKYIAWGRVLMKPLQWLWYRFFNEYKIGTNKPKYDSTLSYNEQDFVMFTDKSIYVAIQNVPVGIDPTNQAYWYKTQNNFIGIDERIKYTSQKLTFEYALNRWFEQSFVNPPATNPIYITNNLVFTDVFRVGLNSDSTSFVSLDSSGNIDFVGAEVLSNNQNSFTIHYPSALPLTLYPSLSPLQATERLENQIKNIADKIKISGTIYNITTP